VVVVGGKIQPPRLLERVEPEYPLLAQRAGIEGEVVLEALLSADGRVEQVRVLSGRPLLATSAQAAVEQWRYEPTTLNGRPVAVLLRVTVQFHLRR
jgi:protein TonB